jgi:hypothetical protein
MEPGNDGYPKVGSTARTLGVRIPPDKYADVHPDGQGRVGPGKGMSVAPRLVDLDEIPHRVPARLGEYVYGASGKDSDRVFAMGKGPFVASTVAPSLHLVRDKPKHGYVEPDKLMPLADYQAALAATRTSWEVDEVPRKAEADGEVAPETAARAAGLGS